MPKYSATILEEELKNKVAADWFAEYDTTQIVGRIDFAVAIRSGDTPVPDKQRRTDKRRGH